MNSPHITGKITLYPGVFSDLTMIHLFVIYPMQLDSNGKRDNGTKCEAAEANFWSINFRDHTGQYVVIADCDTEQTANALFQLFNSFSAKSLLNFLPDYDYNDIRNLAPRPDDDFQISITLYPDNYNIPYLFHEMKILRRSTTGADPVEFNQDYTTQDETANPPVIYSLFLYKMDDPQYILTADFNDKFGAFMLMYVLYLISLTSVFGEAV